MRRLLIIVPLAMVWFACPKPLAARCDDGVRNGEESDVDCGGSTCPACADSLACLTANDCDSGVCRANLCGQPPPPCMGTECPQTVSCRRNTDCVMGVCVDGTCVLDRCDPPLVRCGARCIDPRFDGLNCGGCGIPCQSGELCNSGLCMPACQGGLAACGFPPNVQCVDTNGDVLHCGNCATACRPGELCRFGTCVLDCPPPRVECNGECVLVGSDVQHCGGCNAPCDGGVCVLGQCAPSCSAPLMSCPGGGPCADVRFDPLNCGGCGMACPAVPNARPLCLNMSCTRTRCDPGFEDCTPAPGCETNLMNDAMNCGACGRPCLGGPCMNGFCS